jgi:hypothetical protein
MLLGFLMTCVLAATSTKLGKLQPIGRSLLILGRYVVAVLAFATLEHNVIARHNPPNFRLLIANCRFTAVARVPLQFGNRQSQIGNNLIPLLR